MLNAASFLLSTNASVTCPIATFVDAIRQTADDDPHLSPALSVPPDQSKVYALLDKHMSSLEDDAAALNHEMSSCVIARDKLRAELGLVEARMEAIKTKLGVIATQEKFCVIVRDSLVKEPDAMMMMNAARGVPTTTATATSTTSATSGGGGGGGNRAAAAISDDTHQHQQDHALSHLQQQQQQPQPHRQTTSATTTAPTSSSSSASTAPAAQESSSSASLQTSITTLLPLLHATAELQQASSTSSSAPISEDSLLAALERVETQLSRLLDAPFESSADFTACASLAAEVTNHLCANPRPSVQVSELKLLASLFSRAMRHQEAGASPVLTDAAQPLCDILRGCSDPLRAVAHPLHSVNDDVKAQALETLNALLSTDEANQRTLFVKSADGLTPLLAIVATSSSEVIIERALCVLWNLAVVEELRVLIRQGDALPSVLDLLYSDSLPILENAAVCVGYMTREDETKEEIVRCHGLEKLVSSLLHPSLSVQAKIAGAVWNCASNDANRGHLRRLGCVPVLLELLGNSSSRNNNKISDINNTSDCDLVLENAAGALWNLSVDQENKAQILDYDGLGALCRLLAPLPTSTSTSSSSFSPSDPRNFHKEKIIENTTGVLWNCTSIVENRAALRKCGGIPLILQLLRTFHNNERVVHNVSVILRNCAVNDQNKAAIREAGGIEIILDKMSSGFTTTQNHHQVSHADSINAGMLPEQTMDRLTHALWILSVAPENKHAIRHSNGNRGLQLLLVLLRSYPSESVQEKLLGILRNCTGVPENRRPLLELGVFEVLNQAILSAPNRPLPQRKASTVEYLCGVVWNLSRDDKNTPRETGFIEALVAALGAAEDTVIESAAGAVASLTVNNSDNRACFVDRGGLELLAQCVERPVVQSRPFMMQNVLSALRNVTSSNESAQRFVATRLTNVIPILVEHHMRSRSEEIVREALLCVKNLCGVREGAEAVARCDGSREAMETLAETSSSDSIKKAAQMALQALMRTLNA